MKLNTYFAICADEAADLNSREQYPLLFDLWTSKRKFERSFCSV